MYIGQDPLDSSDFKYDIAGIATLLKKYLRELSTPLFAEEYEKLLNCGKLADLQDQLVAIRGTINELHPAIITLTKYLFRFLYRVSCNATENKMGSASLAVVFGPILARPPDLQLKAEDLPTINKVIQLCIDHHKFVFAGDEEEGDVQDPDVDIGANVIPDDSDKSTDSEDGGCIGLLECDSYKLTYL
jgi:hypothetical protein